MGEATSVRLSKWAPASGRRTVLAWAEVAMILVLGWGAYTGTLLPIAGFGGWPGIAWDGEERPASCAPTPGWRKFEMAITLAQLVAIPVLVFKGSRSAWRAWFDRSWMLWLSAVLLTCIAVAPLSNPHLGYLP